MINWNGDVVPCCRDPHGRHVLGNVFEQSLREVWNSEASLAFRRAVVSEQSAVDICSLCSGYGIPKIEPVGFKIEHHTVNDPDYRALSEGSPVSLTVRQSGRK